MITKDSRREQRRLLHQEISRAQLLDAATEIFGRKGFHATTLKEIAEAADFSVGSVYSFFENKDDLYASIWLRSGEEFLPPFEALVDSVEDGLDGLIAMARFEIGFFRDRPAFSRLYLRSSASLVPTGAEASPSAVVENAAYVLDLQARVIARGQSQGRIRAGDPAALGRLFTSMVQAFQVMDVELDGDSEHYLAVDDFVAIVRDAFGA